jgi:hypothetical protein
MTYLRLKTVDMYMYLYIFLEKNLDNEVSDFLKNKLSGAHGVNHFLSKTPIESFK